MVILYLYKSFRGSTLFAIGTYEHEGEKLEDEKVLLNPGPDYVLKEGDVGYILTESADDVIEMLKEMESVKPGEMSMDRPSRLDRTSRDKKRNMKKAISQLATNVVSVRRFVSLRSRVAPGSENENKNFHLVCSVTDQ